MTTAKTQPETVGASARKTLARMPPHLKDVDLSKVEIPVGETPEDVAERLARQESGRIHAWQRRLPKRYAEARVASLKKEQDPHRKVSGWLATESLTLLLTGEPARGKTYAAYAVGASAVAAGFWTVAWTSADLNAAMRPGGEEGAYDEVVECDVLLLDDLGREQVTAWSLESLQRILDARNRERKRTICTTNSGYDNLLERYGEPVVSRLVDDATVVKITGEALRGPTPW